MMIIDNSDSESIMMLHNASLGFTVLHYCLKCIVPFKIGSCAVFYVKLWKKYVASRLQAGRSAQTAAAADDDADDDDACNAASCM